MDILFLLPLDLGVFAVGRNDAESSLQHVLLQF